MLASLLGFSFKRLWELRELIDIAVQRLRMARGPGNWGTGLQHEASRSKHEQTWVEGGVVPAWQMNGELESVVAGSWIAAG